MFFKLLTQSVALAALAMIGALAIQWIKRGRRMDGWRQSGRIMALFGILVTCMGAEAAHNGYTGRPPSGLFALAFLGSRENIALPGIPGCDEHILELEGLIEDRDQVSRSDYIRISRSLLDSLRICADRDGRYGEIASSLQNRL